MPSTYTIAGGVGSGITLGQPPITQSPVSSQTLHLKITPANGGTIVQVQASEYGTGDLHIIPDGSDFDKELGKIITMSKLRS